MKWTAEVQFLTLCKRCTQPKYATGTPQVGTATQTVYRSRSTVLQSDLQHHTRADYFARKGVEKGLGESVMLADYFAMLVVAKKNELAAENHPGLTMESRARRN